MADFVDVSPDMEMYTLLESFAYNAAGSISEYIDNALQAYLDAPKKVRERIGILNIKIKAVDSYSDKNKNYISIHDNGVGIKSSDLAGVMKPAKKPEKRSLSEYGIGMKSASMWFGKRWSLVTQSIEDGTKSKIIFDLNKLIKDGSDQVEHIKDFDLDWVEWNNGVEIRIEKIHQEYLAAKIWKDLQEIYQLFTSRKDAVLKLSFEYNGTELGENPKLKKELDILHYPLAITKGSKSYSIGDSRSWKVDIDFKFNNKRVTGFLALRKQASPKENPGIRLFRYKRLIRGMAHNDYRPVDLVGTPNKHAPSRVYGELHLDGQKISNNKSDFLFDEHLFIEALKNQEGVEELLDVGEQYRQRKVDSGSVIHYDSIEEYEEATNSGSRNTTRKRPKKKGGARSRTRKKKEPISILSQYKDTNIHLLGDIIEETIQIYKYQKWWSFALCYRTVVELGIRNKIKDFHNEHYGKIEEKSIIGQLNYLHSNQQIFSNDLALKQSINALKKDSLLDVMNLSAHGHYHPWKTEIDNLLKNTEKLLSWIFEHEDN